MIIIQSIISIILAFMLSSSVIAQTSQQIDKTSSEKCLIQAKDAYDKHDISKAIQLLKKSIQYDPSNNRALHILGSMYLAQAKDAYAKHDLSKAIQLLQQAIQDDPKNDRALYALGTLYIGTDSNKALKYIRCAASLGNKKAQDALAIFKFRGYV